MSKLIFYPHSTSELNDSAVKMYETHGHATHKAKTRLDETVLLFPVHNGEHLALCYRIDEYGDHEEYADEWHLETSDIDDLGDGRLSLDTTTGLF